MGNTIDASAERTTITIPEGRACLPAGYSYGALVNLLASRCATWIIREVDGAACLALLRPDVDDAPTSEEIDAAIEERRA